MPTPPLRLARCLSGTAPSLAILFCTTTLVHAQAGLRGEYFDSPQPEATQARLERVDERLDFHWERGVPEGTALLPDGHFSARWTGWIELPRAGAWTFITHSDDGVQLDIGGLRIIDHWDPHEEAVDTGLFLAQRPGWQPLELRYFNARGPGRLRLEFEGPGQARAVVPPTSLCSLFQCVEDGTISVDAGPDQVLAPPEETITLTAAVSGLHAGGSTGGDPFTVTWTQVHGPPVTPQMAPSNPGIVVMRVKVTSPLHGTAVDDTQILVFGAGQGGELTGIARKWDKVALTFTHDTVLDENSTPNPFLDFRLQTYFYHPATRTLYNVPGFFAADGNAADTGATQGDRWRTNFSPDQAGEWFYLASFRTARGLAIDPTPTAGLPLDSINNLSGSFSVGPTDPRAGGFVSSGRLEYVGTHHLRQAENQAHFLKGGADSPENFLAYYEFDGTSDLGGAPNDLPDGLHHYDPHVADYVPRGVPFWQGGKGRRIFGAIDYLARKGVNSLYALSYNIDGGDGREVYPWSSPAAKMRFDVSKLAQWERVVDHMMRAGVAWHVVTQETENDRVLDFGELGNQRRLYYRELIARFGHAGGLVWNLGEENNNTPAQRRAFADYLHQVDPYDHPVALHNHNGNEFGTFTGLLGSHLELVSLQADPGNVGSSTRNWVQSSENAGRPWIVNNDEQGPANDGVVPDAVDLWHDGPRTLCLWPNLMGGGGGCEWYFGYAHPHSDLDCEDFRSRDMMWKLTTRALNFFRKYLPFARMHPGDSLVFGANARVLASPGEFYAVYLPQGGSPTLDLGTSLETFTVSWFDPRNGGGMVAGTPASVTGPGFQSLGNSPSAGDWVAFVRRAQNFPPVVNEVSVEVDSAAVNSIAILVRSSDPNGPEDDLRATVRAQGPGGFDQTFNAVHRGGNLHSLYVGQLGAIAPGQWSFTATVTDSNGDSDSGVAFLDVAP
jgi:hypothetical protein